MVDVVTASLLTASHVEVLSDQYWDMRLSGLTTCLCLLFLLSALLTCVVCAHALLVFTSVSPSKMVWVCLCNCEVCFSDFTCLHVVAITTSPSFPSSPPLLTFS